MELLSRVSQARILRMLRQSSPVLAAMVIGMLILSPCVFSSQSTLVWDRCLDPEVIGYRLYYGNASRDYLPAVEVGNQTTCKVDGLVEGIPYFFAVTAYDQYGNESDYSEEVSQTIYENAEALSISGWDFCPGDSGGAGIQRVFDEDLQRSVIELAGSSLQNCFRLRSNDFTDWNNSYEFVLTWSMKSTKAHRLTVVVAATSGILLLQYVPLDGECVAVDAGVRCGMGTQAIDGQWHHFTRNLQTDLDHALTGTRILKVRRLLIRGSGRLIDIKLLATPQ